MTKFEQYRIAKKYTYNELAIKLGFGGLNPSVAAERYCKARRFPRPTMLLKIEELTNQEVTVRDLIDDYIKENK